MLLFSMVLMETMPTPTMMMILHRYNFNINVFFFLMGHTHNLLRYNVIMGIMGIMGIFWIMLGCYNVKMGVKGV